MKAYLNSVSPPSNLTNKKDSFTPSAHDSTPEYYSPFKTIINKKNDDTPKHIFERNNQLTKMKERLSKLVEQTESLSRQKRHFSEERKSVEKVTDLKIKGLRVKPENEIDSPIKGLDILKYQTPKYESSQGYIGFSVEPVQKINQRNSRKSSPKYDDKRVTETHECQSNVSQYENFEIKENPEKSLKKPVYSLGSNQFQKLVSLQNIRRKSMLDLQPESIQSSRYSQEKSRISHQDYSPERSGIMTPEIQILCLKQENKNLIEEVKNLNNSRIYYQQQLIGLIKKQEQRESKQAERVKQLRKEYQVVVDRYLTQMDKKDEKVSKLMDKIIKTEQNENKYEKLCERIQELEQQNKNLRFQLLKRQEEITEVNRKMDEQIQIGHQLINQNNLIQSQFCALQEFKNQFLHKSNILSFDDALKIQLSEIESYKKEIESLKQANESLKVELREKVKYEQHLKTQEKLEKIKESSLKNKVLTEHSILVTNKQNEIKVLQNKIKTLEDKNSSALTQIQEKDNFIKNFIQGRSENMNIQELLKHYEEQFIQKKQRQSGLADKIQELTKKLQIYEQISNK